MAPCCPATAGAHRMCGPLSTTKKKPASPHTSLPKDAMKAKEAKRLSTVRLMLADIQKQGIAVKNENLSDAEILGVLTKMIKQRDYIFGHHFGIIGFRLIKFITLPMAAMIKRDDAIARAGEA